MYRKMIRFRIRKFIKRGWIKNDQVWSKAIVPKSQLEVFFNLELLKMDLIQIDYNGLSLFAMSLEQAVQQEKAQMMLGKVNDDIASVVQNFDDIDLKIKLIKSADPKLNPLK
ncbi:hypothetical protein [Bergeyella sp. RCAD1439]|uniref:hypothetical protein n=1 Tax=Bergeyella anatis TaxID=3113737 RepID=UPI002E1789AC|nr:hypothetical protein [Bergeyella sp. RCAD1439]